MEQHNIPLTSQVGGHAGISTTEDGSLIIKPALVNEVKFYNSLASDPAFASLRPFAPKFFGTLRLQGSIEDASDAQAAALQTLQDGVKEDKVLENLSHPFLKPNILDIKLGTVLYDEGASPEKRERMIETARKTTSLETGVRLTGFQVYDNTTGQPVNTPKSYGNSIKVADLPDGIAKFFPLASAEGSNSGLPRELLLPILESIRLNLAEIQDALQKLEFRMVGGSFLIIYEADLDRAKEGVAYLAERGGLPEDEMEDDDDEDDEEEEEDGKKKAGMPYIVKLIDFAHTKIVPGEGPDQGVLLGVETTLKLLDGRVAQVRESS